MEMNCKAFFEIKFQFGRALPLAGELRIVNVICNIVINMRNTCSRARETGKCKNECEKQNGNSAFEAAPFPLLQSDGGSPEI